jgi:DNA-binding PadR family transcriptional regulator
MRFGKKFGFNREADGEGGGFGHHHRFAFSGRGRGRGMFGEGGPFGRGFGGPDMGRMRGKLLSSEEMHLIILELMSETEIYGYEIMKATEAMTSGVYTPSPGMIYPLLNYITELGHATSEADGNRKRFKISEEGKKYLEENREKLLVILEKIKAFSERFAAMNTRFNEEESAEEAWGRENGGSHNFDMRREFHEIRHQLRKALFSKRMASVEEKNRVLEILRRAIKEIMGE